MSQPHTTANDELIAAVIQRAEGSGAHKLGLRTSEELQAFGWPAIENLVRYVEWEWRKQAGIRSIVQCLAEISALLAFTPPEEVDYALPLDRRPRNLRGQLMIFGPDDRRPYKLHFVEELDSVDTHLSVKYDSRHELLSFNSARIMSVATHNALRTASSQFIWGWVNASLDDSTEVLTAMYHMLEAREL